MKDDVSEMKKDIGDIKSALLGSEYSPDGVVTEVRQLREDIDQLNALYNRAKYIVVGIGIITALIWEIIRGAIKL